MKHLSSSYRSVRLNPSAVLMHSVKHC